MREREREREAGTERGRENERERAPEGGGSTAFPTAMFSSTAHIYKRSVSVLRI